MLYLPPMVIIFINTVLKAILRRIASFEKRRNLTSELISSTQKMFFAQFINTAIVLLLINGGITWITIGKENTFDDFTVEWYREVGSTLTMTMMFSVVTPHISNACF